VAKDRSKGKNTDNIDTSFLFPEILRNKKVKVDKKATKKFTKIPKYFDTLEEYLETENPDKLIDALRIDDYTVWSGRRNYDEFSRKLYLKQHIPDYFIVWRTLEHWIKYYNPHTDLYEEYKKYKKDDEKYRIYKKYKLTVDCTKKYLYKISPLLAIHKEKKMMSFAGCGVYKIHNVGGTTTVVQKSKDGLLHKGHYSHQNYGGIKGYILEYSDGSGKKFLNFFNEIKNALQTNLKKRYPPYTNDKLGDIVNTLKSIDIEINEDELDEVDISHKDMIVSSVLAILHKRNCIHKTKARTIYNLYKEAEIK